MIIAVIAVGASYITITDHILFALTFYFILFQYFLVIVVAALVTVANTVFTIVFMTYVTITLISFLIHIWDWNEFRDWN